MPSPTQFWAVLTIAIAQVVLGGAVLVTNSPAAEPLGQAAVAGDDEPRPELIDAPPETIAPGSPSPEPSAPAGVAPPPGAAEKPKEPGGAPTDSRPANPLRIHSTNATLSPEERSHVDSGPPYESAVEGRMVDDSIWRLSAYEQPTGDICSEIKQYHPAKRFTGTASGDCQSKSEWGFGGGSSSEGFMALTGFVPLEAASVRFVAKNDTAASTPGAFRQSSGATFYVGYLGCDGPDLARVEALDAAGRVLGTYGEKLFAEVGFPSFTCDMRTD